MSTVLILGLKPISNTLTVQMRSNNGSKSIKWTSGNGWCIDSDISVSRLISVPNPNRALQGVSCLNCNKMHPTNMCNLPFFSIPCIYCLVISNDGYDGYHHINPCRPVNTISDIRTNLLASNALTLLQINYPVNDVDVMYMAHDASSFKMFTHNVKLVSVPAESLLTFREIDTNTNAIAVKQYRYKRCSILIVVLDKSNMYRVRFLLVFTPIHGVLVFSYSTTPNMRNGLLEIPAQFTKNTIVILLLKPKNENFYIALNVFANETGRIDLNPFNGYVGHIGVDLSTEYINTHIDLCIDGRREIADIPHNRFNAKLYKRRLNAPLSTFKGQRHTHTPLPVNNESSDDDWTSSDDE